MTSQLLTPTASFPEWDEYATLIAEAMLAFRQDPIYAVLVVESARSLSEKKSRKPKSKG